MIKRPIRPKVQNSTGSEQQGNFMRKMLAIAAIAVVTITSTLIATTGNADAQFRRWGPAAIAAGVVTGAIIANSAPYERCGWVRSFDRYGNYMGRTWACSAY
jgi:hypothetical protein